MKEPVSIAHEPQLRRGMDYHFLREEGIRLLQELSGDTWTDYNHHDPGVTILEHLCYALTDLGYRTDLDMENLFRPDRVEEDEDTLFDPLDILPARPLTLKDYRILLIDRIPNVSNAWLEPVKDNNQGIQGLYRISLHLHESLVSKIQERRLKRKVLGLLNQHRNLCEDFESVQIIETEDISIHAEIDISPDSIGETIITQIISLLKNHLSPTIESSSLSDLLEVGTPLEEILNGPRPINGIIRPDSLLPLPTEINTSQIIELVSSIEGVLNIRKFVVYKNGLPANGDVIPLEKNCYPILKININNPNDLQSSKFELFKGGMEYALDWDTVRHFQQSLEAVSKKLSKINKIHNYNNNIRQLKLENIQDYYSIQHLFPSTYGIGAEGTPASANQRRRAAAKQLKAYLLIFDQLLANYLAQLSNIKRLFSLNNKTERSYFSQIPWDVPALRDLIVGGDAQQFSQDMNAALSRIDPYFERRNQFLDHLLARFGEDFITDSAILNKSYSHLGKAESKNDNERALIHSKTNLLRNYPHISQDRGGGFNHRQPAWENDNVPALKKKVVFELGISKYENTFLSNIKDLAYPERLERGIDEISEKQQEVRRPRGIEDETKNAIYYEGGGLGFEENKVTFFSSSEHFFSELLAFGQYEKYYTIYENKNDNGKKYSIIFTHPLDGRQIKIYETNNRSKAKWVVQQVVAYFRKMNNEAEGFYVVEHILLRPLSPIFYGFNLINDDDEVVLQNISKSDMESLRIHINDLMIVGTNDEYYNIILLEEGYHVEIKNADGLPFARLVGQHEDEAAAGHAIEDMKDYLESLMLGNVDIFTKIEFSTEERKALLFHDNFYSHRMTVALPAWPLRFQHKEFRRLFEGTFCKNAPAHLHVDFHWLSMEELGAFEQTHKAWIDEKSKSKLDLQYLDDLSFELVEMINAWNE